VIRTCALLCLIWMTAAYAQTGASLEVLLTDSQNGAPWAASVTLWPTNLRAQCDRNGTAEFEELAAGEYRLEAQAAGCISRDTTVTLEAGAHLLVTLALPRVSATLPEVVVETQPRSGSDVRLFDHRAIRRSAARSLPEFLEEQAGIEVRSEGTAGSPQTVRIGGSNTNQVLVLVDGRRLQDLGTGEADLSAIPLDWVESVEISRGGRADAGGEAIGGILRITTRNPGSKSELSGRAEVYSTYTRLGATRSLKSGWLSSLVSYVRTQGPGNFRYRKTEEDGLGPLTVDLGKSFRRANADVVRDQLLVKLSSALGSADVLELSGSTDNANRGMPGYLAPQLTPLARQNSSQQALNLRLAHSHGPGNLEARASYQHDWRDYEDPDAYSLVHSSRETSARWEGEVRGGFTAGRTTLAGGASADRETLESAQIASGVAARTRLTGWTQAGQVLLTSTSRELTLSGNAGLRWEKYGEGQTLLPNVSLSLDHVNAFRGGVTVSWGKSYRAPDFYSLFWLEDKVAQGNPDLRPEVSSEWTGRAFTDIPFTKGLHLEINASDQRVSDLIYWKQIFDNSWKPFNLKQAHVRTLDMSMEQAVWHDRLHVTAGINWTEARDATGDRNTGGKFLTFRAPRSYRGTITLRQYGFDLTGSYRWCAARPVLETNSKWLKPYDIVDLRLVRRLRMGSVRIEPGAGVNNLLDRDYRIVRFAPMPCREFYGTIMIARE
jgi:outer membrane cobalamin receptor